MSRKQPELADTVASLRLKEQLLRGDPLLGGGDGEGLLKLKDLLPRLLERWHWIFLATLFGLAVGCYQVWRAVPQYQSVATVLVRDYNVNALGKLDAAEFDLRNSQAIATVQAGFTTYELCESVASDFNVRELTGLVPPKPKTIPFASGASPDEPDAPPAPVLAGMIRGWMTAGVQPETRLISISVVHPRPRVAQVIANEVVDHYMKQRTASRTGEQKSTLKYLMAESGRVKGELIEAKNVMASYTGPLEAEKAVTVAEADVDALGVRYGPKHPKMAEAQGSLDKAMERLREGLLRAINNPLDAEYWGTYRENTTVLDTPTGMNQVRDLLISRHAVLESEIESQNSLFATLLNQIETRQLTTETTESEVAPQSAARPGVMISPNKPKLIMTATMMGLMLGLGLAFAFQHFDNKFHSAADLEGQLHLPVLAAISALDEKKMERDEALARVGEEGEAWVSGRELWLPTLVFRTQGAHSNLAEMFRVLRTSVSLLGPSDQRKINMVTSALPSEGKTFVAANLAVACAQQGLKTLLVDFDLRKPSVHKMFGLSKDGHPGIVDLLAGNMPLDDVLQTNLGEPHLSLILSGPKAPNPGELLESGRLEKILTEFRKRFDCIVFDTAPLLAVPDSRLLAPIADNLVMVVRAEQTPRGPVKEALSVLKSGGVSPEGLVLNGYVEKTSLLKKYTYGKNNYGRYGYGEKYGAVYGEEEQ